jgi:hypothetical protein
MPQEHYVGKPGGQKTQQQPQKTQQLKQLPGGEVAPNVMTPVPGTGDTPAAEPTPAVAAPKPRTMQARETMLQPAVARVARWSITVDHGTQLSDLERPDFWAALAPRLTRRQGDLPSEITVSAEDGSFWAELVVLDVGTTWAKCRFKYPPLILDRTEGEVHFRDHTISFAGGGWNVIRDADHSAIGTTFANAQSALSWLDDHLKAMAA